MGNEPFRVAETNPSRVWDLIKKRELLQSKGMPLSSRVWHFTGWKPRPNRQWATVQEWQMVAGESYPVGFGMYKRTRGLLLPGPSRCDIPALPSPKRAARYLGELGRDHPLVVAS